MDMLDQTCKFIIEKKNSNIINKDNINNKLRETKLRDAATREAYRNINYEKRFLTAPTNIMSEKLLYIHSSPPIICFNGEFFRYSKKEWNDAVNEANEILNRNPTIIRQDKKEKNTNI